MVVDGAMYDAGSTFGNVMIGTHPFFIADATNPPLTHTYRWEVNGVTMGNDELGFSSNMFADGDTVACWLIYENSCLGLDSIRSNKIELDIVPNTAITMDPDDAVYLRRKAILLMPLQPLAKTLLTNGNWTATAPGWM